MADFERPLVSLTAAVIQPYFVPYAGYFRLFAAADVVVMFDCVQFPRRGWVHRNRLPLISGELDWLTLPIAKAPRDARICDVSLAPDAEARLAAAIPRFPILERAVRASDAIAGRVLRPQTADMTAYLIDLLKEFTTRLGLERPIVRSSSLPIAPELRAQDRVIAILRELSATAYVNPSGGRELYDRATFSAAGLELAFLRPYGGPMESILGRMLDGSPAAITDEIRRETIVEA